MSAADVASPAEGADVAPPSRYFNRKRRGSVSAECDTANPEDALPKRVFPKTEEEKRRIEKSIANNILFSHLDDAQRKEVFEAMFEAAKKAGEVVIKQGDEGDNFYLVDSGTFDVYVKKEDKDALVLTLQDGGSFGELALMYNCPRAATVKARTDGKLWAMDRATFRRILMDTTSRKRKQYEDFLKNVPLLASMDFYERCTIADALMPVTFKKGETVINQGDIGDVFYIIEEGDAVAKKAPAEGGPAVEVMRLKKGDYFGELSLLTDKPRAASVVAVSDLACVSLDRNSFVRLLGPVDEILKRNMAQYKKYEDVVAGGASSAQH
eukprot:tig00001094_g6996.t1